MALVTDQIWTSETGFISVTYDDVTFDLDSVHLVCTVPTTFIIRRKNGNVWREVTVPVTDQTFTFPAGPIRNLDDIPLYGAIQ